MKNQYLILIALCIIINCAAVKVEPEHTKMYTNSDRGTTIYVLLTKDQKERIHYDHSCWYVFIPHKIYIGKALESIMHNTLTQYFEKVVFIENSDGIKQHNPKNYYVLIPKIREFYLNDIQKPELTVSVMLKKNNQIVLTKDYKSGSVLPKAAENLIFFTAGTDTRVIAQQTQACFEQVSYLMADDFDVKLGIFKMKL